MNVLWFECTVPGRFRDSGAILGGWQDSLEEIVRDISDIRLTISFEVDKMQKENTLDGVRYVPIFLDYSAKERKDAEISCEMKAHKILEAALKVIDDVKPDIIHVFGTEWFFGLVANYTTIPVVIHIQGAILPFNNAMLPPRYSIVDVIRNEGLRRPISMYRAWKRYLAEKTRETMERHIWRAVGNYMGRTEWDKALSEVMHPGRKYFHVEEALRPVFLNCENCWHFPDDGKIRLISTGIISFRKGIDMMLKTAEILSSQNFNYEWNVAGVLPPDMRQIVERKEGNSFENINLVVHGFLPSDKVWELLADSTIYIHTSYAENSPNAICEAQCLGIPVISTNVGGISSLVENGEDGILVPANDPWYMAYQIINLAQDCGRMQAFSRNAREKALKRHNRQSIANQLMNCYNMLAKS